jgi:hypothetical protein
MGKELPRTLRRQLHHQLWKPPNKQWSPEAKSTVFASAQSAFRSQMSSSGERARVIFGAERVLVSLSASGKFLRHGGHIFGQKFLAL